MTARTCTPGDSDHEGRDTADDRSSAVGELVDERRQEQAVRERHAVE